MWSSSAGGQRGFTLLEILIALAIVSVALAAVMRTTGMLTTNNGVLRDRALALMSAQNRLVELQLAPPVATVSRDRAPLSAGRIGAGMRNAPDRRGARIPPGDRGSVPRPAGGPLATLSAALDNQR